MQTDECERKVTCAHVKCGYLPPRTALSRNSKIEPGQSRNEARGRGVRDMHTYVSGLPNEEGGPGSNGGKASRSDGAGRA